MLWRLRWRTIRSERARADEALLRECAALYSSSYGKWGPRGPRPGEPIRREAGDIAELLASPDSFLSVAELPGSEIVGYCVAVFAEAPEGKGRIAWVSQLVVGAAFRNQGIATNLLYSIWQFSDRYAWGMVTASPYAVRALESATRRTCRLSLIRRHGEEVLRQLQGQVPYLPANLQHEGRLARAVVDTRFFVSHEGLEAERRRAARGTRPWSLGAIADGEEWFACTFAAQPPMPLEPDKLEEILVGADRVWMDAFARMTLDDSHKWRRHTDAEIELITSETGITAGQTVLDVGCGDGRHAAALGERGFTVEALDVVPALIERAEECYGKSGSRFAVADAREPFSGDPVDLALLLYDVLGASANPSEDLAILKNAAARLKPGGYLVASVMNAGVTVSRIPPAQRPASDIEFVEALEALPPSNTMEASGDIFDPSLLLFYRGVHYRKEQFLEMEDYLPSEHVVRDLRYSPDSLRDLVAAAGLKVQELRAVQAGHWGRRPALSAEDPRAKELLVIARREEAAGSTPLT